MTTTTISINADYLALVRRYSELSSLTAKGAIEYAIDQILVSELTDYLESDSDTEVEALIKAANVLLPDNWLFSICVDGLVRPEALIGFDFGLSGAIPTYVTRNDAQIVRDCLYELPNCGGRFHIVGKDSGNPIMVRRQGQGVLFQLLDKSSGEPTGAKASVSTTSVPRITMAMDSIISASRKLEELNK